MDRSHTPGNGTRDYLVAHDLPLWFLQPEHTACAVYDSEAEGLALENGPSPPFASFPPSHYLETRYPAEPQYPIADALGDGSTYCYRLANGEHLRLARRFPATAVNVARGDSRIFVTPAGYVILRDDFTQNASLPGGCDRILHTTLMRWLGEDDTSRRASYAWESNQFSEFPCAMHGFSHHTGW